MSKLSKTDAVAGWQVALAGDGDKQGVDCGVELKGEGRQAILPYLHNLSSFFYLLCKCEFH